MTNEEASAPLTMAGPLHADADAVLRGAIAGANAQASRAAANPQTCVTVERLADRIQNLSSHPCDSLARIAPNMCLDSP
ncbi:hypothetical protein [Burkholderia sp. BCC0397]|uniref:hypothetical protein n=1 Tax=Burkholderia sp. BCC0397 TaxID=486876 RepID=UPI00158B66A4|nr:hypothetical protein [Burkholderia sp. BCC0397]